MLEPKPLPLLMLEPKPLPLLMLKLLVDRFNFCDASDKTVFLKTDELNWSHVSQFQGKNVFYRVKLRQNRKKEEILILEVSVTEKMIFNKHYDFFNTNVTFEHNLTISKDPTFVYELPDDEIKVKLSNEIDKMKYELDKVLSKKNVIFNTYSYDDLKKFSLGKSDAKTNTNINTYIIGKQYIPHELKYGDVFVDTEGIKTRYIVVDILPAKEDREYLNIVDMKVINSDDHNKTKSFTCLGYLENGSYQFKIIDEDVFVVFSKADMGDSHAVGGKKTYNVKHKYTKTMQKHVGKDGVSRVVYKKANSLFVKRKREDGTFNYMKIRALTPYSKI
jgi:hypothetical protein